MRVRPIHTSNTLGHHSIQLVSKQFRVDRASRALSPRRSPDNSKFDISSGMKSLSNMACIMTAVECARPRSGMNYEEATTSLASQHSLNASSSSRAHADATIGCCVAVLAMRVHESSREMTSTYHRANRGTRGSEVAQMTVTTKRRCGVTVDRRPDKAARRTTRNEPPSVGLEEWSIAATRGNGPTRGETDTSEASVGDEEPGTAQGSAVRDSISKHLERRLLPREA